MQRVVRAFLGQEATGSEIIIFFSCSILLPLMLPLYSLYAGYHWSILQLLLSSGIGFDMISGCLVYNSVHHKNNHSLEKSMMGYVTHALLHMQPLVIASFYSEKILLPIGVYWFIMYMVFVSLLGPTSRSHKKVETIIVGLFIVMNLFSLILCILFIEDQSFLFYGVFNYIILGPLTVLQFYLPVRSKRFYGTAVVVIMSLINSLFLKTPHGFQWFVPVLCIKLFMGYNARERISPEV